MAITARTPTVVESASTTTITGTRPADAQAGDIHIATFCFTTSTVITGPAGWTALYTPTAQGTTQLAAYYAIGPGSDPTASYSGTAGRATVIVQAWGGQDTTTPIDVAAVRTAALGTSLVATGVTTATSGALLVSAYGADSSTRAAVIPSGMTQVASYSAASSGKLLAVAAEVRASAGATGSRTWAMTPAVSIDQIAYTVAIRQAPVQVSGAVSAVVARTGSALRGKSGAVAGVASPAGGVLLGITDQGSGAAAAAELSGGVTVTSRNFVGTLEIEFTDGTWTDVTDKLNFSAGPLTIRQGKPGPYEFVNPGVMTLSLYNASGEFMSINPNSPYYPNVVEGKRIRWKVTKNAVTYTRFYGWIQSWEPDFPTGDISSATVMITATDALGVMAQRKVNSNFTERSMSIARANSCTVDVYEAVGKCSGFVSVMKNCSTDASKYSGSYLYATTDATLEFGEDNDTSIGGTVTVPSANSPSKTVAYIRSSQTIIFHVKTFGKLPTSSSMFASLYMSSGSLCSVGCGSTGNLALYNTDTFAVISSFGTMPIGQWVRIKAKVNSNPALSDWAMESQSGYYLSITGANLDIRTVTTIIFPGMFGDSSYPGASIGGVVGINAVASFGFANSFSGSDNGTISSRVDDLVAALSGTPVETLKIGPLSTATKTGVWSGKSAHDVSKEIMASGGHIVWARPKDGKVLFMDRGTAYSEGSIGSVDTDGDCIGTPKISFGADNSITRVDVNWPGGTETYVNTTKEAGGLSRSRTITTSNANASSAVAEGSYFASSGTQSMRIQNVVVDLVTGVNDLTSTFFNESSDLSGIFPHRSITIKVPYSHFGVNSRAFYVVGWEELYSPSAVTVKLDVFW